MSADHQSRSVFGNGSGSVSGLKGVNGPVLKQVDDAYAFLDKHSETSAASEGVHRIDHRACPTAVLREALLNAIVHRDYAYSACTLISVYGKHKICTYAPAFFLRETAGNGEEHFTVSCEGVNILLYKPDGYSHLLQVPDRFQKVNDVAGKPADVFQQDNVD